MPRTDAAAVRADVAPVHELELPADPGELAGARRHTAAVATAFGLDRRRVTELVYAVNEAVTNAIRHGRPDAAGLIRIRVFADPARLTFAVSDHGRFLMRAVAPQGAAAEHGRGFALMRRFADQVSVSAGASGTTVLIAKDRR